MTSTSQDPRIAIPIVLLGLPTMLIFISFITSRLGWHGMATKFPADSAPQGELFSGLSGSIGLGSYRGSLNVILSERGIFCRKIWLFSLGHSPVLLPWKTISAVRKGRGLFSGALDIAIPVGDEQFTIRFPERMVPRVLEWLRLQRPDLIAHPES